MAMIDNTLAAQTPQFNLATTLQQGAQAQAAQDAVQAEQLKAQQNAIGAEMRGLTPFVNTPEFPQKWAERMDSMLQNGLINQQAHDQWSKSPSPLMMKSIIAKTDSPEIALRKTEDNQAQSNSDRTFAANRSDTKFNQGIALRAANRADDETPDGFEANPAAKTDPNAPRFRPLSGGPQDPNYLTSVAKAKGDVPTTVGQGSAIIVPNSGKVIYENKAGTEANISDDAADFAADRILAQEKGVKIGYGRGAQGAANIIKIDAAVARKAKERGLTADDLVQRGIDLVADTSAARTEGTQQGRMSTAGIEASGAIRMGLEASDKVPRGNWVPVNKAIQAYLSGTSDPALKAFGAANLTIVNTYARAINPSGNGNVHDKVEAATKLLNEADGPEAYKAVAAQMQREIDLAHTAPALAREALKAERARRMGGGSSDKPSAADRFKQLIGTGLSKDQAYAKMHEEGY